MFRVHVKDFQSIQDAEIEVDGFTVITGPNNSGKSAMLRAVRGVFQNTSGTSFVRYGAKESSVELDFGEDKKVAWVKGPSIKPHYIFNDTKILHPGRKAPVELGDLGVAPLQINNRVLWPQFAPQFTGQVFLLDQPGSVIAEAVADVERVGRLNQAMRAAEKDLRSTRSTIKVREADRKQLEADLDKFEGLDELDALVADLSALKQSLDQTSQDVAELEALQTAYIQSTHTLASLSGVSDIDLPSSDELQRLQRMLQAKEFLCQLQRDWTQSKQALARVASFDVASIPPPEELQDLQAEIQALKSLHVSLNQSQSKIDALADFDFSVDLSPGRLVKYPKVLHNMRLMQRRLETFQSQEFTLSQELDQLQQELLALPMPEVCPTCGKPK